MGITTFGFAETISLSFDESLEIANRTSYRAVIAALEEKEIDIHIEDLWFQLLPELGYRINLDQENKSYDFLGSGDPALTLPYSFYGDSVVEVNDESTLSKTSLKQEVYFRQQVFGSDIRNIVMAEENKRLQKEIIKTQLRKYLLLEIRMNYFMAILYGDAIEQVEDLKEIYELEPKTNSQTKDVVGALKKRALIDLDARKLSLESSKRNHELTLLSLLHLPLDSEMELTTPLDSIAVNSDNDSKKALENSVQVKYYLLNSKRMQNDLSSSVLDYLPMIRATLSSEIADRLGVGLTAYFNGSSSYGLDLTGNLLLDERDLQLRTYGNAVPAESLWDVNSDLDFSVSLTYSLDSILNTTNHRAMLKNDIMINENRIKDEIQNTLQQLALYSNSVDERKQSVQLSENLLQVAMELKSEIDENFTIESLSDVTFYNSLYGRLQSELNNLNYYRRQLYESYFWYQNIVEGD